MGNKQTNKKNLSNFKRMSRKFFIFWQIYFMFGLKEGSWILLSVSDLLWYIVLVNVQENNSSFT